MYCLPLDDVWYHYQVNFIQMSNPKILLTQSGYDSLTQELNDLITVQRPNIIKYMEEARTLGDLRENAAYHAAREKQAVIQGRIEEIQHIVKHAKISKKSGSLDKVEHGSTVEVTYNGATREFMVVGEQESDISIGKISAESPVGSALIGRSVGDTVTLTMPQGSVEYEITSIS